MDNLLIEDYDQTPDLSHDEIGDDHISTGLETPMKANAFEMSDDEKKICFAQGERMALIVKKLSGS